MLALRRFLLPTLLFCVFYSVQAFGQATLTTVSVNSAGSQTGVAAINPITNRVYVGGTLGVAVLDGATNNVIASVPGFSAFLAVNPTTNRIYSLGYCDTGSCQVSVIDGASNTVVATVPAGHKSVALAVNTSTNKIYVVNNGDDTVSVIDGATNTNTATITVGGTPTTLAINLTTNTIFVLDQEESNGVYHRGDVAAIDGASNIVRFIQVGFAPGAVAINENTNQIYVANGGEVDITAIDGTSYNTTTVEVGYFPSGVGVNTATNLIYVVNQYADSSFRGGSVTVVDGSTYDTSTIYNTPQYTEYECRNQGGFVQPQYCTTVTVDSQRNRVYITNGYPYALTAIDGATNSVTMTGLGDIPGEMAFNPATQRLYVPNSNDSTLSVIDPTARLQFVPLAPCRVADTRGTNGIFGGPAIQGGAPPRSFPLPQGNCGIPSNAIAYSLNVTAAPQGRLGYLNIFSSGLQTPNTSTLNSDGRVKANAVIVQAGVDAGVSAYASNTTDLILDINGYFVTAGGSTLAFFPLAPCRVVDTRNPNGQLGGPALTGGVGRSFPVLDATQCDIPSSAQAYSLNFTVVPQHSLAYLTVWASGQDRPQVSTLNDSTGTVVANAAIVPAGLNGAISAYASDNTNLIVDINGYFAPPGTGPNPQSLYTLYPCRALDTRNGRGGEFSGELVVDILDNANVCPMTPQAQGYALNATVIPVQPLGYLTLWPDGEPQPSVSTLNARDGALTSNMAVVPTSNGLIDAYTNNLTHLLLDITGYFAP